MIASSEPVPFEVYAAGVYLHGTKVDLAVGEMLVPGRESNFEEGRVMNLKRPRFSAAPIRVAALG
jgi:rifampin ADP-ribosylating transferase